MINKARIKVFILQALGCNINSIDNNITKKFSININTRQNMLTKIKAYNILSLFFVMEDLI